MSFKGNTETPRLFLPHGFGVQCGHMVTLLKEGPKTYLSQRHLRVYICGQYIKKLNQLHNAHQAVFLHCSSHNLGHEATSSRGALNGQWGAFSECTSNAILDMLTKSHLLGSVIRFSCGLAFPWHPSPMGPLICTPCSLKCGISLSSWFCLGFKVFGTKCHACFGPSPFWSTAELLCPCSCFSVFICLW